VQRSEGRIAVAHRVDQDPNGHEVVDVLEVTAADDHLLVDGVVVLGTAGHDGLDLGALQVRTDLLAHSREELLAGRGSLGHQADDLVVDLRVQRGEGEVLQLPLDRVHAKAVRQRGVDLQRLAGLALRRLPGYVAPRAGVVQPVGELDDQDADVPRHGDHHLADGLRLRGVAVADLVELGHPVDEHRHFLAEVGLQCRQAVGGVLDGVVEQGGRQGCRGHAQLGEDGGHGERVGDVGVAALA
jgi:hypothetical protein